MKTPHETFCVLPWISLEASPIGTLRPCCLADHEIQDDQGVKISVGEMPLADIRNTRHMTELRQQFLRGERPVTCRRCWAEEDAGRTSKRMHTLDRLKHIVQDDVWDESVKPLMFMDLKLGNICNLKCRICGSWSSSTYAAEEIKHQADKKNNFHYVMMRLGQWPRQERKFWQDLEHNMSGLRYLEFTGGEPFMIQEHFDLLDKLVRAGHASQIEIHYNTNGTVFPQGAEELWRHFRHVEIAFSIDDVGARFEYQRSGADWSTVNGHIDLFRQMRRRNSNLSLQVCTTVSVFNVLYLDEIADWIDGQDFDFVYWNMLHDAPHHCVANLPMTVKKNVQQALELGNFSPRHADEIQRIIVFMNQGQRDLGADLIDSIRTLDQRRGQDLVTVAPELANVLGYVT